MLLSELIKQAQDLQKEHGDVDVLSHSDYHILNLSIEKATTYQLKEWDMDPNEEYKFVKVNDDD